VMTLGEKMVVLVAGKRVALRLFCVPRRTFAVFAGHAVVAVAAAAVVAAAAAEEARSLDIAALAAGCLVEGLASELASGAALGVASVGLACVEEVHVDVVAYLADLDCKLRDWACTRNHLQVGDAGVAEERDSNFVSWVRLH